MSINVIERAFLKSTDFASGPSNVLYRKRKSKITGYIQLSYLWSSRAVPSLALPILGILQRPLLWTSAGAWKGRLKGCAFSLGFLPSSQLLRSVLLSLRMIQGEPRGSYLPSREERWNYGCRRKPLTPFPPKPCTFSFLYISPSKKLSDSRPVSIQIVVLAWHLLGSCWCRFSANQRGSVAVWDRGPCLSETNL